VYPGEEERCDECGEEMEELMPQAVVCPNCGLRRPSAPRPEIDPDYEED
jgi:DNA-directed RNA polymerase subunit RPC12/RpoP